MGEIPLRHATNKYPSLRHATNKYASSKGSANHYIIHITVLHKNPIAALRSVCFGVYLVCVVLKLNGLRKECTCMDISAEEVRGRLKI